ncbi:MAG TPA: pseudouridine synthase [Puia sp.]|nr:pseudouridine synthase [Puia sp.]
MKRKTDNFSKFYNKKNNAAIKEAFRQEKKAAKKERKEAIERHFEEKRKAREQQSAIGRPAKPVPPARTGSNVLPAKAPSNVSSGSPVQSSAPDALPLNKYIAHGGICSRRDAAELIRQGKVQVNGQLVTEPGTKVSPNDLVKVNGKKVTISRNFIYILLNKPKDYITTTDDPQGRKTVLDLIRQATPERVFPIGRLDRNTSGVLLLTNDGDLAQKLAHPKHEIKKIYHVTLDKPLTKADFDKIAGGITLEDGVAYVDVLAYADAKDKTQIGLEIHSGRNRIVRRIFEHLGYDVRGLDRVMYAGLTKKNVQRGHWRLLTEKEIRILKYLNSSFRGSLATPKAHKPDEDEQADAPAQVSPKRPAPKKFNKSRPAGRSEKPATGPARDGKKPPQPNGGLRGRKSGGSYIKSKAKSQHASTRSTAPRSPRPTKPSGRRPH